MTRPLRRLMFFSVAILPAIIPTSCARPLLQALTPFLIDGDNAFLVDVINLAAPFVLP